MPYDGPLFTSQAPFFPIFLAALVSTREEDYDIVNGWFEQVVSGTGCRSVSDGYSLCDHLVVLTSVLH